MWEFFGEHKISAMRKINNSNLKIVAQLYHSVCHFIYFFSQSNLLQV